MCLKVVSGQERARLVITNPKGVSGFQEYRLANFEQRFVAQPSQDILEIEVISRADLDTRAEYPLRRELLPPEVLPYLEPSHDIQSDNPEIASLAAGLVRGLRTEAEAVDAIFVWVRDNITYDLSRRLPVDALSVLHNRSGVCSGFANLSVALLRAGGIPARVKDGCATRPNWGVSESGGLHSWIEAYYPDAGWIASDPQSTENYLDTCHIVGFFEPCGDPQTTIRRELTLDGIRTMYYLRTEPEWSWGMPSAANVIGWDRHPLHLLPPSVSLMLPLSLPTAEVKLRLRDRSCFWTPWSLTSDAFWLQPAQTEATGDQVVTYRIEASGLPPGSYGATVLIAQEHWSGPRFERFERQWRVNLILAEQVYELYLPQITHSGR
jgi:transglutaminase-like putative cysteine protease